MGVAATFQMKAIEATPEQRAPRTKTWQSFGEGTGEWYAVDAKWLDARRRSERFVGGGGDPLARDTPENCCSALVSAPSRIPVPMPVWKIQRCGSARRKKNGGGSLSRFDRQPRQKTRTSARSKCSRRNSERASRNPWELQRHVLYENMLPDLQQTKIRQDRWAPLALVESVECRSTHRVGGTYPVPYSPSRKHCTGTEAVSATRSESRSWELSNPYWSLGIWRLVKLKILLV